MLVLSDELWVALLSQLCKSLEVFHFSISSQFQALQLIVLVVFGLTTYLLYVIPLLSNLDLTTDCRLVWRNGNVFSLLSIMYIHISLYVSLYRIKSNTLFCPCTLLLHRQGPPVLPLVLCWSLNAESWKCELYLRHFIIVGSCFVTVGCYSTRMS